MKNISKILVAATLIMSACNNNNSTKTVSNTNQETQSNSQIRLVDWAKSANLYEVNIRQYTPEGTFNAFMNHLPRLKEQNVDILWLMPINTISVDGRKGTLGSYYAVQDYKKVNPEFGTIEDLKKLVNSAHSAGMKVIIDWVANHTGKDNIWTREHKDWFTQDDNGNIIPPEGTDWDDVADLNYDNPKMRLAMIDAMKFWLKEADIDGFRCDVAGMVPTDFWQQARTELSKIKPIFMLAEDDKPTIHAAFDATYNWKIHHCMNSIAQGKKNVDTIVKILKKLSIDFPKEDVLLNFTSNHDENSWSKSEYDRMGDYVEQMAVLSYFLPGMPLCYSGQEAANKKTLRFFDKDTIDFSTLPLKDLYAKLNNIKHENSALWNGAYGSAIKVDTISHDKLLVFSRQDNNEKITCIFNFDTQKRTTSVNLITSGVDLFSGKTFEKGKNEIEIDSKGYYAIKEVVDGNFTAALSENLIVQPQFWFSGMKNKTFTLLIHGDGVSDYKASIKNSNIKSVVEKRTQNINYLFLDITVADNASACNFEINLKNATNNNEFKINYELKNRKNSSRGFSDKDLIYMILPDRFANGDPSNDNVAGYYEIANNNNPDGRHGGDIKGIADNVNYFKDLGVTALWINPLLQNNMPAYSYHGYAITDFYETDARFGSNEDYKALADKLHQNGIKLIMDMVFNHCGSENFLYKDLPDPSWIHNWENFTRSNYRGTVCFDPHASQSDQNYMLNGWFDVTMPDLNQNNELMLNYLIQNSVWWAEYLGLDAIRMDTYPYNDKQAMKKWCNVLHEEFPGFSILGEVWLNENPFVTYFANDVKNLDGYTSGLDHVTDFPLTFALNKAFNESEGWETGLARIYQSFVSDYQLPNPQNNVIFADNHDLDRIATIVGGDVRKLKMIYTILLTTRGIPCLYYGSEVKMESPKAGDGWKRQNFYGGWQGDVKNAFTNTGLSNDEADLKNFVTKLANFRKTSDVFSGKMIHFVPQDGVYVYFRISDNQRVMVIINNNDTQKKIDVSRYAECLNGYKKAVDVISNEKITINNITVGAKSTQILNLE